MKQTFCLKYCFLKKKIDLNMFETGFFKKNFKTNQPCLYVVMCQCAASCGFFLCNSDSILSLFWL